MTALCTARDCRHPRAQHNSAGGGCMGTLPGQLSMACHCIAFVAPVSEAATEGATRDETRLRGVEATLAMVDDIDWEGVEPRAFVISDGERRTSYDRDNFARLLLGMPMRELPPEPPLAVGDVVKAAADLDRLPVGTVLRDGRTLLIAWRHVNGWSVNRDVAADDVRGFLTSLLVHGAQLRIIDLPGSTS